MTDPRVSFPAELVDAARGGDPAAVEDLLRLVLQLVGRIARRRLVSYPGGLELATDVAQETLIAVADGLPGYVPGATPFGAWACRILAYKIADAQRRTYRSVDQATTYGSDLALEHLVDAAALPADVVVDRQQLADNGLLLRQLLATEPEQVRLILLLHAAGVPAVDIGARFGLSAGNVRVIRHRAMLRLTAQAQLATDPARTGASDRTSTRTGRAPARSSG